jgi:peptidoglycan/LPS O-acetylase OafA/YrhL
LAVHLGLRVTGYIPEMLIGLVSAPAFALILVSIDQETTLNRCLAWTPLVIIGEASYSLYLFHPVVCPIVQFHRGGPFTYGGLVELGFRAGLTILLTVALAGLLLLLERPVQRSLRAWLKRRLTGSENAGSVTSLPSTIRQPS